MRWWLALVVCLLPSLAHALALEELRDVRELQQEVAYLRDPTGELTFADARHRDGAFTHDAEHRLPFGFDYAALWLRFPARNEGELAVRWLLEVGEPSLDHVDVYRVHRDGSVEHLRGGDALPFASRTLAFTSPTFELVSAPHEDSTYYLRVQSDDVLRAPLRAWLPGAHRREHDREMLLVVAFFGALLLIAAYHVGVFVMVRQRENAWFSLVALSLASVLMGLSGQLGACFLPEQPLLANRLMPLSLALAIVAVGFSTHASTDKTGTAPELTRALRWVAISTPTLLLAALVMPTGAALRMLCLLLMGLTLAGPAILYAIRAHQIPEMTFYRIGWYALISSIPAAILRYAGVVPDTQLSQHALGMGFVAYSVANSLALAALANRLRGEVSSTNDKLAHNVEQLTQALVRAEEAHDNALRATKAKDEFMATMSHELRTPLNTIINIPQGLANEFVRERSARCAVCDAAYLLDDEDDVDANSLCEDCGGRGTLVEGSKVRYRGDSARALRFLQKIERSGQHLLQMVNGVLDYSKLEAGRFQLMIGQVELDGLMREVADLMSDGAQRRGVTLVLQPGEPTKLTADGPRLKQVLTNLVANAIKFSDAGGVVTLRWSALHDSALIAVEDRGIGIAAHDHERIFASFEQVHKGDTRKYGGTGLGLSISRSLVRMHGGELSVQSALGQGATFVVRMPRVTPTRMEQAS